MRASSAIGQATWADSLTDGRKTRGGNFAYRQKFHQTLFEVSVGFSKIR